MTMRRASGRWAFWAAAAISSAAAAQTQPTSVGAAHMYYGKSHYTPTPNQTNQDNLIYHGGTVLTTPAIYLVFWGPEWQTGFTQVAADGRIYNEKQVMNYVTTFFARVGGSAWAGVQTQYCQGANIGAVDCTGVWGPQMIQNPRNQLKGTWIDPSPVPATIVTTGLAENETTDDVALEAISAARHFGYDLNAVYFVFTPPGHAATAYGSVYCAFHAETTHQPGAHGVRYAFMPYVPEQGASCGGNSVNANDSFGHGYLDGMSIAGGHEFEEAVTDPGNFNGTQDGWNDPTTSENGDKCAYKNLQNIQLGDQFFAVQPMWSNAANSGAGGCAMSLP